MLQEEYHTSGDGGVETTNFGLRDGVCVGVGRRGGGTDLL